MKPFIYIFSILFIVNFGFAQDVEPDGSSVTTLVESRRFVFSAESASPLKGRTIFLSPGYSVIVRPDSVVSYLPYYGRSYQASMDPSDAGIKFTSTDFQFTEKTRKKGGWDITIKPKDVQYSPQLYLTISPNGQASLRVISSDKQSISFNGNIVKQQKP